MSQIAVRLTDEELQRLDSAVAQGVFPTRAEAVRAALALLEKQMREERIAGSYSAAYGSAQLTEDETAALDAALALSADEAP